VTPKILFQSDTVLVIDKPAGLAVHRGPRGGPSLEDDLPALQQGKRHLPQPAHRLDQDTAGCLVLGRTKPAMAELGGFFARGEARKTYWAVLGGAVPGEDGRVDAALLKTSTAKAGWRMVVDAKGQVRATLPLGIPTVQTVTVRQHQSLTAYDRWGIGPLVLGWLLALLVRFWPWPTDF
jgi:23S rRNA-/tRNA-specific pseudouridylate synthase